VEGRDGLPIACTLQAGSYQERLAWIAALARDGLRGVSREDLRLELRYAPEVASRVREMVGKEQECCGFLSFELTETDEEVRLTITAPEQARDVADTLFEQFVPPGALWPRIEPHLIRAMTQRSP
jgi:hypothetical protein